MNRILFLLFIALISITCAPGPLLTAKQGVLDLSGYDLKENQATLNGEWQFYWQKLAGDLPSSDSGVEYVTVPHNWTSSGHPSFGYATYKLVLKLDKPSANLAFTIKTAATSYRMYVNGNLVLENGKVGKTSESTVSDYLPLVSQAIPLKETNEIMIEVANFTHSKAGLWDSISIGNHDLLVKNEKLELMVDSFIAGSMIIMFLYHLSFYYMRRKDLTSLFFAVMCLMVTLRIIFVENQTYQIFPGLDWKFRVAMSFFSIYIFTLTYAGFIYNMFPQEATKKYTYLFSGLAGISPILVLVTPIHIYSRTHLLYTFTTIVIIFWTFVIMARAIKNKRDDAVPALAGSLLMFATAINDILYSSMLMDSVYMIQYGLFIYILIYSVIIAGRLSHSFDEVEILSMRLTTKTMELEEKNLRLKSLDRLKDEFLANTSHELKTPLQGIIGIADSLARGSAGKLPENISHQLEMISRSGKRLARLVNDILDFSKLKHKDISLDKKPVDVFQIAEFIFEMNQLQAKNKNLKLLNHIPADFPLLYADEDRLMQIIQNLVSNAIKYTNQGQIELTAVRNGGEAEICVRDTGIGVAAEFHDRIFESFEQLDMVISKGTGLGLSITKSLVELHDGQIRIESEENRGSAFYFTLPLAPLTAIRPVADKLPTGITQAPLALFPVTVYVDSESNNARILVIDDDEINLQIFANYLGLAGHSTVSAMSGEDGLEILKSDNDIDLVILDLMMPNMSGLVVAREIRQIFSPLELPILMLTAKNQETDYISALNSGANDFMGKPVEFDQFNLRVGNLLNLVYTNRNIRSMKQESREAIRSMRDKINLDLHDHLGGQLIDLKFISEELAANPYNPELIIRLNLNINETIAMLRQQMLNIEDWSMISEDFIKGINLVMLRRYSASSREFDFNVAVEAENIFKKNLYKRETGLIELYSIINEVITNDMKYGTGVSEWDISVDGNDILLYMTAVSSFNLQERNNGRGTGNLTYRVARLKGQLEMGLVENRYFIKIRLPGESFI